MKLFGKKAKSEKSGKKVLVVDDENNICTLYKIMFTREGYNVEIAKNGEEAIRIAETFEPDIVLLDVMMPGINGLDVLHALKRQNPSLPVILHSAHHNIKDNFDSVIADAFLEKSGSSPSKVLAKVREFLDEKN